MDWKKILKIISVVLILALVGYGIYYFFSRTPAGQKISGAIFPGTTKVGETTVMETKTSQTNAVAPVTEAAIFDYWVNSKNGGVYYLNEAGQALRISGNNLELINTQTLPRLNKVFPSGDGTYAAAKFNYPFATTFSIFNTVTDSWQPLPAGTIAAAWSPTAPEIAYVDGQALKILNLTSQKTTEVIKMSQPELELRWRKDNKILISVNSGATTKILLLNPKDKTVVPFLEENNLVIQWSKNDNLGLKLTSANQKPVLSLINGNGVNLTQLTFLTMPEKCLLSESKIYCAVPKNIKEGIKLPDDYYKRAIYFDDALYLIDLSSGGVSDLKNNPEIKIDAEHLELNNNSLLFKNRLDRKLYSLAL